ncbi:hypothetical protein BB561_000447 [Smittium simulii]|uniref:Ion transport domain-containing protein n=1 Tax=Smittium simulii TaxID=133385 RepID=A0A2T9YZ46_9FUNG|nr:hypothetical protein BB561_000447 [Smittium simulii]
MAFITFDYKSLVPLQYIRLLKVFRVLELYRFGQTSISVKIVIVALKRSLKQITAALISVFVLMIMSSSVMFLVENSLFKEADMTWYRMEEGRLVKSPFQSVPGTFYWSIVTLTTTGFGDQYPVTNLGKLVAGVTMIFGVAVIAIPTSIIGANLTFEWNNKRARNHFANKEKFDPIDAYCSFPEIVVQSPSSSNNRSNSVSATKSLQFQDTITLNEIKSMIVGLESQIKSLSESKSNHS